MAMLRSTIRNCLSPVKRSLAKRGLLDASNPKHVELFCLQDMKREDFQIISKKLGKAYMEEVKNLPTFPVEGFIFEKELGRKCVLLAVKRWNNNAAVWVPFVLHGGSPKILLGRDAMIGLGLNPDDRSTVVVNIQGFDCLTAYHESKDKRLRDVNIIGWSFLRDTNCYEHLDVDTGESLLFKNYAQFLEYSKLKPTS